MVSYLTRMLILILVGSVGWACSRDSGSTIIHSDELKRNAEVLVPRPRVSFPPLGVIQYVLSVEDSLLLVLNRSPPHLYLFEQNGTPRQIAGNAGSGPGELTRPRTMTLHQGDLWVVDGSHMARWTTRPLAEVDRRSMPPRVLTTFVGCHDRFLALYQGIRTEAQEHVSYGLQEYVGDAWKDLSGLSINRNPLVLGTAALKPVSWNGQLAYVNYSTRSVDVLSCNGVVVGSLPLPIPDEWENFYLFARGATVLDERLAILYARTANDDTTQMAIWMPKDSVFEHRKLIGDLRIYDSGDSLVWMARYTPEPELIGLNRPTLNRILELTRR